MNFCISTHTVLFYNGKWEKYTMLLIEWDNGILFTLYSRINLDKGYQSQFNEPVLYSIYDYFSLSSQGSDLHGTEKTRHCMKKLKFV